MSRYKTIHTSTNSGGNLPAMYRIYTAIKAGGMVDFIDSSTVSGGDPGWSDESDPEAGSFFVIASRHAFSTGKYWQALFARGGADVGGEGDPGANLFIKVSFTGGWEVDTHKFGSSAVVTDWMNVERAGNITSYTTEWYVTSYSYTSPDNPSLVLDGVYLTGDRGGEGKWILGACIGKFRGVAGDADQEYPFIAGTGVWTTQSTYHAMFASSVAPLVIPDPSTWTSWQTAYLGPISDMLNESGRTFLGEIEEWPIRIDSASAKEGYGLLSNMMQSDRSLGNDVVACSGTRKLINGLSWPLGEQ